MKKQARVLRLKTGECLGVLGYDTDKELQAAIRDYFLCLTAPRKERADISRKRRAECVVLDEQGRTHRK